MSDEHLDLAQQLSEVCWIDKGRSRWIWSDLKIDIVKTQKGNWKFTCGKCHKSICMVDKRVLYNSGRVKCAGSVLTLTIAHYRRFHDRQKSIDYYLFPSDEYRVKNHIRLIRK